MPKREYIGDGISVEVFGDGLRFSWTANRLPEAIQLEQYTVEALRKYLARWDDEKELKALHDARDRLEARRRIRGNDGG
jgi:hypothetical protein